MNDSNQLLDIAQYFIPKEVNSPVRAKGWMVTLSL